MYLPLRNIIVIVLSSFFTSFIQVMIFQILYNILMISLQQKDKTRDKHFNRNWKMNEISNYKKRHIYFTTKTISKVKAHVD